MKSKQVICIAAVMATVLGLSGCADRESNRAVEKSSDASGPIVVFVTNYPLQYFAQRIGGEYASVQFPAPADEDPAYWTPSPEIIGNYQNADLILLNGAGYEKWTEAASLPRSKLCDTSSRFTADDFILAEDSVTHSHGPEGQHAHGGMAFTVWLDPTLALKQADAIVDAFAALRPQHAEEFRRNRDALARDLEKWDQEITSVLGKASNRPVLFSHPVYQYLQRRYGLNGISVHWEPDEEPSDAMWAELQGILQQHPAKWMIWEDQPLDSVAQKLAELGLTSVVYNPCGNTPPEGDFLAAQRENLSALAKVYADAL